MKHIFFHISIFIYIVQQNLILLFGEKLNEQF